MLGELSRVKRRGYGLTPASESDQLARRREGVDYAGEPTRAGGTDGCCVLAEREVLDLLTGRCSSLWDSDGLETNVVTSGLWSDEVRRAQGAETLSKRFLAPRGPPAVSRGSTSGRNECETRRKTGQS